jgi:hypothetical protein
MAYVKRLRNSFALHRSAVCHLKKESAHQFSSPARRVQTENYFASCIAFEG